MKSEQMATLADGYKKTKEEILPNDWNIKEISDVCLINPESLKPSTDPEYEINYIDITSLEKVGIKPSRTTVVFKKSPSRARRVVKDNNILISTVRPNLRAFTFIDIAEENLICSTGFAVLESKKGYDPRYIYQFILSDDFLNQVISYLVGSNYPAINNNDLSKIKIPVPSHPSEQRKIARILSSVDTLIEKTEAAIAKYETIKTGMMYDLFTRGIDLDTGKLRLSYEESPELYKESDVGIVPKEWEVDTLENSTDYVDYRGKTPRKSDYGIFLVTARNIKNGYIDYDNSKEYIPEYTYETAMSRGKAEIGDVVITTEAPMGNVAQIDRIPVALAQRVIKYRGKTNKLINDFLSIFLMSDSFQRQLVSKSTGSTVLGIKGSRLHKLFIAIPKKNEQIAISKRIKAINQLLIFESINLHKHKQLKQALMSDLLTCKVRVKYEEDKVEVV